MSHSSITGKKWKAMYFSLSHFRSLLYNRAAYCRFQEGKYVLKHRFEFLKADCYLTCCCAQNKYFVDIGTGNVYMVNSLL
jgi:hypothetical protein